MTCFLIRETFLSSTSFGSDKGCATVGSASTKCSFHTLALSHGFHGNFRSSHQKCSMKKVLKNFAKLTVKHLCQILLQNTSGRMLLSLFSRLNCLIHSSRFPLFVETLANLNRANITFF